MTAPAAQKRYAYVGTGGRVVMFLHPIAEKYRDVAVPVAFCDPSPLRMQHHLDLLKNDCAYEPKVDFYAVEEFGRMLAEHRPDALVVCSVDTTHADYIVQALEFGCDVIVEKPIAVTADQCGAILAAAEKSTNSVRVAFNYRWAKGVGTVKELIAAGTVGAIQHVHMEYLLDTGHGADYFRRWHSTMANSGGLLVHKATHHFDLINWWLDAIPDSVFGRGKLGFYGKANAVRRGQEHLTGYERYSGADYGDDPFALDLAKKNNILYFQAEQDGNGYVRDRNVFRDGIDIYDTMSVSAAYRTGELLTYSLVAYSPYEGFRVSFTGDKGRIDYAEMHGSHLIMGQSDAELDKAQRKVREGAKPISLKVFPHFAASYDVEIQQSRGGHGGADPLLQEQIFSLNPPPDALNRTAGWEQGIASAMVGIAANRSIETGIPVRIGDLLPLRPGATRLSELV